jgi:hypothetical protein
MVKFLCISSYYRKPFLIYKFATDSLFMRKICFLFYQFYVTLSTLVKGAMYSVPNRCVPENFLLTMCPLDEVFY